MASLPTWLKPADEASYYGEGLRIGDSQAEQRSSQQLAQQRLASEQAERQQADQRDQQSLLMRQHQLEQQATVAAQKYQAQQAYSQFIASGGDPIQGILKFGPALGASGAVSGAARVQHQNEMDSMPPSISSIPGPDGKPVPVLQGRGRIVPPSDLAGPKPQFIRGPNGQVSKVNPDGSLSDARPAQPALKRHANITVPVDPDNPRGPKITGPADDPDVIKALKGYQDATVPNEQAPKAAPGLWDRLFGGGDSNADASKPKPTAAKSATNAPKSGDVVKGYTFKGGDPSDKGNWEKVDDSQPPEER